MENREKYLAVHMQSGFRMNLQFCVLAEIERRNKGEFGVWKEHDKKIKELASGITEGKFTRYNINEDYIKGHFAIEDELTAYLIYELAFYKAGCDSANNESTHTIDYLDRIDENMGAGFFLGYKLSKETLIGLVNSLKGKALDVASQSRDLDRQKGALREFCESIDNENDENQIISQINLYNDGSYIVLAGYVDMLAYMLSASGFWEEYYQLLESMQYFPLQGALIKMLRSTKDVLSVIEVTNDHDGRKSLHYLLREQCYHLLCEEKGILEDHLEERSLTKDVKIYVKKTLDEYEQEKPTMIEKAVKIWLSIFGKEEMIVWLSGKKAGAEHKHEKYQKPELKIVTMMFDLCPFTSADIKGFNIEDKDFDSLLTLASHSDNEEAAKPLIEAIAKCIFGEQSYPPTTLNEQWFNQQRIIYNCLNQSQLDGLAILEKECKPLEGYRVDLEASIRNSRQTSYWLAMLLLSLEESKDEKMFKRYAEILFRDTIYSINSFADDVFAPYYIAELLVSQVLKGQKDCFERELIEKIPYLVFVIRVLTANQGEMSDEIKKLLTERIKIDWESERSLLSQNKKSKLKFYDDFVAKYITA